MKKLMLFCILACTVTFLVVACGETASVAGLGNGSVPSNDVHMQAANFTQPSITIKKGSSLNIIDDTSTIHIIQNGSWDNGTSKSTKENGAPSVNIQFVGNDTKSIGPFNTAGTYHLYCTVHPGMNLTVVVQ